MPGPFDPTRPGVVEGEPVLLGVPRLRSLWRSWRDREHPSPASTEPPPSDADPESDGA